MGPRFSAHELILAALFAALTAVGAYIVIPVFGPIPFTLQVLFVLLSGLVLGARLGALSMLAYLALGLVAPVYAGGASGVGALLGPAGGYLWGFVVAAFVVGLIVKSRRPSSIVGFVLACLVGLVPIYALGATWLAVQLGALSLHVVVWGGILQFLPLDIVKAILAGTLARSLISAQLQLPSFAAVHPSQPSLMGAEHPLPPATERPFEREALVAEPPPQGAPAPVRVATGCAGLGSASAPMSTGARNIQGP
jgi:biotin transport system substrate-specific component